MKTTLIIDDGVMSRLRQEAVRRKKTLSELVEAALRMMLAARAASDPAELPRLPTFAGGQVDHADRDALYRAMAGR